MFNSSFKLYFFRNLMLKNNKLDKSDKTAAVDIDDTLWDYVRPYFMFCSDRYGILFNKEDTFTYDIEKLWGWTRDKQEKSFEGFLLSQNEYPLIPFDGAFDVLKKLNEKYDKVIAITSRGENVFRKKTEEDLEKHFPGMIEEVYFSNEFWKNGKPTIAKLEICLNQNVGMFIEDSYRNICTAGNAGIEGFLITQPWNINYNDSELLPKNIIRVANIKEILKYC